MDELKNCQEIWKPILNGEYQISNMGQVRVTKTGRLMTLIKNYAGYLVINLNRGISKQYRVHRLVADVFIDNLNNYDEVNHLDGNKTNNQYKNLEWTNSKLNKQHAIIHGLFPHKSVLDSDGNFYRSVREAARKCGVDSSSLSKVCKGEYSHTKGKVFRYAK